MPQNRPSSLFFFLFIFIIFKSYGQVILPDSVAATNTFSKNFLFVPIVLKSPETSWGVGYASSYFFRFDRKDSITRTSNVESIGLLTLRNQMIAMLGVNLYAPDEKYIFKARCTFSKFPDRYWGIGDDTPDSQMERYAYTQVFTNPQLLRKVYSHFYIGLIGEFQWTFNMKYKANRLFDSTVKAGKDGGFSSGLGLLLAWDTRNNSFSPNRGSFLQVSMIHFSPKIVSDFRFSNVVVDIRKFIAVTRKHVLAFQAYGYFTSGDVPFRYLAAYGGADNMRGYYAGRYRAKNQIYLQAEYRLPLFWRFGMVVFSGLGDVSDDFVQYKFSPPKYIVGTGLRVALKPKEKLNLRIDYGRGYNSYAVYVTVSEAF